MARNFSFHRGDTYPLQWQATKISDGSVINLTGYKVYFTIKFDPERDDDSAAVCQLSSPSNGITIDDATNGLFTITIPSSATGSLPNRRTDFIFDIKLKDGNGAPIIITDGVMTMKPAVTITTA